MSLWESIYKYKNTTIQNNIEYIDIIDDILNKYGYTVIEMWSDEYIEKLNNCNGYYFKKYKINYKINIGNYDIWPLREELLKNENTNSLENKKKPSMAARFEENSEINHKFQ